MQCGDLTTRTFIECVAIGFRRVPAEMYASIAGNIADSISAAAARISNNILLEILMLLGMLLREPSNIQKSLNKCK
jgi:hypothetical protein